MGVCMSALPFHITLKPHLIVQLLSEMGSDACILSLGQAQGLLQTAATGGLPAAPSIHSPAAVLHVQHS